MKGIIRGFTERAKALCDEGYREEELKNVGDIFVANGHEREEVRRTMRENKGERRDEEQEYRGVVTVPYVRGLSEKFKRVAAKHSFRTVFKPGRKIRDLKANAVQPIGKKQKDVIYEIPCKCERAV